MNIFKFAPFVILFSFSQLQAAAQEAPPYMEWGPQFNTSGAQLDVKELERHKVQGVTVVSYAFSASGLPHDMVYRFWLWELGSDPQFGFDATIDQDGAIMLKPSTKESTNTGPITVKVFGVPAEPKRFALISLDGKSKAFAQAIPFPLEASDGACKLVVEMVEPLYALVTLRAEGLKPDEGFQVTLQSGHEGGRLKPKADKQGRWNSIVGPFVKGKKEGFTEVQLTATNCKAKITFPWGVHYYQ